MNEERISSFYLMKTIPAKECGEKLVSLRNYSEEIVIEIDSMSKKYEALEEDECYVRESVAKMLVEAQSFLPIGFRLKIFDGYRSLETQQKIYNSVYLELKEKNLGWDEEKLSSEVENWVANPKAIPPHSTGGAVDVTIVDEEGEELDMGSQTNSISENSITDAKNISAEARENREMLIEIMTKAGFVNYPGEWWHWCYGDRMWAYFAKKSYAIYGGI